MRAVAPAALLLVATALAAGCGQEEAEGEPKLTVYVSTPLSGPEAVDGLAVAEGARETLESAGGEAGGARVDVTILDSGPGASPSEPVRQAADPVRAAANARRATQDSAAIAYIGELDAETTATSLPITNDAGMLQVSPSAGDPALVAPFEGSDEVPPETQPSGSRTFGTLAPLEGSPRELGAEAMAVILDSIERADDPLSRGSVITAFLSTADRDSELGTYSIDEVGEAQPESG
jgi:hypothetical protein